MKICIRICNVKSHIIALSEKCTLFHFFHPVFRHTLLVEPASDSTLVVTKFVAAVAQMEAGFISQVDVTPGRPSDWPKSTTITTDSPINVIILRKFVASTTGVLVSGLDALFSKINCPAVVFFWKLRLYHKFECGAFLGGLAMQGAGNETVWIFFESTLRNAISAHYIATTH